MDGITPAFAAKWLAELVKAWSSIARNRKAELQYIQNNFTNPELLLRSYIEPDCQQVNPANHDENEPIRVIRTPVVGNYIYNFLEGEFAQRDGRNILFVLSDAGMGKTSLLVMLKFSHWKGFWPGVQDFVLLRLGEDTRDKIEEIQNRSETVLLLDSLDEDPTARGRSEERLLGLMPLLVQFRQVILTCRTQFFPKTVGAAGQMVEQGAKIEVGGYSSDVVYLSPFSDEQVEAYLAKKYPNNVLDSLIKWVLAKDNESRERARAVVKPMRSLRMRPMLLAHIEDLLEANLGDHSEYSVYAALVEQWLKREQRKQNQIHDWKTLLNYCEELAIFMQKLGVREVSPEKVPLAVEGDRVLQKIATEDITGRSLLNVTSTGLYRFAHYSLQEFLVARRIRETGLDKLFSQTLTDQIRDFLALSVLISPKSGYKLRYIRGGTLNMGSPDRENGHENNESPMRKVEITDFLLGEAPVTNEEYQRFMEANPNVKEPRYWGDSRLIEAKQPVVGISWHEAQAYCEWAGLVLPTEAQWEYACRARTATRYWSGDDESHLAKVAWYKQNSKGQTQPVREKPANPFGLHDMHGNVWEWCQDWYGSYENLTREKDGLRAVNSAESRVVRGGCWIDPAVGCRSAYRGRFRPQDRDCFLGFRPSRVIT